MSTDTSTLLPNRVGVSDDSLYTLRPSCAKARTYRTSIPATNAQSWGPGSQIIAYIPSGRRNTYLDAKSSYIRYTVQNVDSTAGNNIAFDNNGYSIFNRFDCYHGGNLLESIQSANVLLTYVLEMQLNQSQRFGLSTAYGMDPSVNRAGATIAPSSSRTCCMPIPSGVFGMFADKALIPICRLNDDIRWEITLESQIAGMVNLKTTTNNWKVISFELELVFVELSDEGESIVQSVAPINDPLFLHGTSFRHFQANYATSTSAQGQSSILVPARFSSIKQLAVLPRPNTSTTTANLPSISNRINPNWDSINWRIGSAIVPNKLVYLNNSNNTGALAEAFMELLRSWHAINAPDGCSSLTSSIYNVSDTAYQSGVTKGQTTAITSGSIAAADWLPGFAYAQELEIYAQKSGVLCQGLNSLGQQIFFECSQSIANATDSYTLNFYAWYDHIMIIDPTTGIMSARF
jgi:hypothetical protein